jgi:hypothetical protein
MKRRSRKWDTIRVETSERNKAPSQLTGWNPDKRKRKKTTDKDRTQISEPSLNNVEKSNSSKDQPVLGKSLDELESFQMENEVKNILLKLINLVIYYGEAKPIVRRLWKALQLYERHYKKNKRESTN